MTRIVAIDWSGARTGAQRKIWIAEARNGNLVFLERGRDRHEVASWLIEEARQGEQLIVGMDFAFSFPAWFLDEHGCHTAPEMWRLVADKAEGWLKDCNYPFWGRPGKKRLVEKTRRLRQTETGTEAKSAFQIGGAGAVGTGSLRGMPVLDRLQREGFAVWPFTPLRPNASIAVEIYPRLWSRGVIKSNLEARHAFLNQSVRFRQLGDDVKEAMSYSEDSFDAAISALAMDTNRESLERLARVQDPILMREGIIWGVS